MQEEESGAEETPSAPDIGEESGGDLGGGDDAGDAGGDDGGDEAAGDDAGDESSV